MKGTTPFSKREWVLLIIILLMTQFMVHWLSLKYGTSVSALGYVSFAGTVVSILLGLIAIIYAFVQSFTQASSVVEIREQIDKLIVAGDAIVKSKDDLHQSAIELGGITDELSKKINESILATREVAGNVGRLSDAFASQKSTAVGPVAEGGSEPDENTINILRSGRAWLTVAVLAIAEGVKRGWTLDDVEERLAFKVGWAFELDQEYMSGVCYTTLFALEAEGFIELPNVKAYSTVLVGKNNFIQKVEAAVPRSRAKKSKQLAAFWSVVDELDEGDGDDMEA